MHIVVKITLQSSVFAYWTGVLASYIGLNNQYGLPADMVLQVSPSAQIVLSEARRLGYQLQTSGDGLTLSKIAVK